MRILVLGTHNQKKRRELESLLVEQSVELQTLADFPDPIDVVEDGESFAENAALKASQQATHLHHWVLGEDSGISVAALDNQPGIFSARFSGPDATDQKNNETLLSELADTPRLERTAFYTCHLALADPSGEIRLRCEARCHGLIRFQEAGSAGFGYDPLFEIYEYHRTFGELGDAVKAVISHRSRAIRKFLPQLAGLIRSGDWHLSRETETKT